MIESKIEKLDLTRLQHLARALARHVQPGDCILLEGDLGAGKTQFSKFFVQSLTDEETDVPSPTFTIVQTYDADICEIWHFDLYRIEDPDELEEIGWYEDIQDRLTLVEWPERLGNHSPKNALKIEFSIEDNDLRDVKITGDDPFWTGRLQHLDQEMSGDMI